MIRKTILFAVVILNLTPSISFAQEGKTEPQKQKLYKYAEPARKDFGAHGVFKARTLEFRNQYLTEEKRLWLSEVLYASANYRPYIIAKLKERKMPLYLQYLPIVESNYKPTAVSRSGATGLWQFMANSMSPYLKKTDYYDERLDPWKETDAALSKLQENYKTFRDWNLALAAYNMGAGAVSRILKKHPGKDFWYLAEKGLLSKQASDYVPKLIAISDIIENAALYGAIEVGAAKIVSESTPVTKFSYLKIKGCIKLETISSRTGIPLKTLQFMNPELKKGCTPPKETYNLRLPYGKSKEVSDKLKSASKS